MNPHLWWYLARASGYVAWAMVTLGVISGLVLSSRLTGGRARPAWTLDLHRFLAGAGLACTGLHLLGLVADGCVHFGAADLLVPFASGYRAGAVALGVVSLYLLAVIEISSLLMRRLPRRIWHGIHLTSYVAFWSTTFHLLLAGTDAGNPWARAASLGAMAIVGGLSVHRSLVRPGPRRRGGPERRAGARQPIAGRGSDARVHLSGG